jgi:hypothetical protein
MKKAHYISFKNIIPADAVTLGDFAFLPSVYTYGDGVYYIKSSYNPNKYDGYTLNGILELLYHRGDLLRRITV